MMNRRTLFASTAATALSGTPLAKAMAWDAIKADGLDLDIEPRGSVGLFERLPSLNVESGLDFHTGYRVWMYKSLHRSAMKQAFKLLRENALKPSDDLPLDEAVALFASDPLIALDLLPKSIPSNLQTLQTLVVSDLIIRNYFLVFQDHLNPPCRFRNNALRNFFEVKPHEPRTLTHLLNPQQSF